MPKLPRRFINCSVYIYKSVQDARTGEATGACGFLANLLSSYDGSWFSHIYVVTNSHVIKKAGARPTLRLNKRDGSTDIVQTSQTNWYRHSDGDDVAVHEISIDVRHEASAVGVEDFVKEDLPRWVGVGTETLMVGRFVSHAGRQRNTPVVRYGNIAMMSGDPIELEGGVQQNCFLVEMRSIPGASGSAVFGVYSFVQYVERGPLGPPAADPPPQNWVVLLGIDFCHLNTHEKVRAPDGEEIPEKYWVQSNAGMAAVVPAWRIRELLESEELVQERTAKDKTTKCERDAVARVSHLEP